MLVQRRKFRVTPLGLLETVEAFGVDVDGVGPEGVEQGNDAASFERTDVPD